MIYKDLRSYMALPDIYSMFGLLFSILSIFLALNNKLILATIFILVSTIFDFADGRVARKRNREGRFGVEFDNLCDVVLYLISIVIFGFSAGLNNYLAIGVFVIFIMTGMLRLARFAITGTTNNYYEGLPVSYSISIPLIYILFINLNVDMNLLLWFYFIPSFLMISTKKIKKP
ncbi:MAG: CDP-alcohol phosphatidyltransferase family protein [DPANN group archaeon]|nr:CDP-alcohol phosphatidyltransferase family protein [DPANN group archaeon]